MRYYKPWQARKVLGNITPNQLKAFVDRGIIHRYTPPEGGQEVYSKDEVDALARKRREFWGEFPGEEEDSPHGRGTFNYSGRRKAI